MSLFDCGAPVSSFFVMLSYLYGYLSSFWQRFFASRKSVTNGFHKRSAQNRATTDCWTQRLPTEKRHEHGMKWYEMVFWNGMEWNDMVQNDRVESTEQNQLNEHNIEKM